MSVDYFLYILITCSSVFIGLLTVPWVFMGLQAYFDWVYRKCKKLREYLEVD